MSLVAMLTGAQLRAFRGNRVAFAFIFSLLVMLSASLGDKVSNTNHNKKKNAAGSWRETKLALDSLDSVLENSRKLQQRLRQLISNRAIEEIPNPHHSKEVKDHFASRDDVLNGEEHSLEDQLSKGESDIKADAVVKASTTIESGKSAQLMQLEQNGKDLLPPPPEDTPLIIPPPLVVKKEDKKTWTSWTGFSSCHLDLTGSCSQKRKRLCVVDDPTLCPGADKYGVEEQFKDCNRNMCRMKSKSKCVDIDDHFKCRFWAQDGKCDKEPDLMWKRCCASCKKCVDKDPNCSKMAARGECKNNKQYMETRCPASCQICARS